MEANSPEWWAQRVWGLLSAVRRQSPLVQCITNFVSMDLMTNTLLSVGASPAMLHTLEEIPQLHPPRPRVLPQCRHTLRRWQLAMKLVADVAIRSEKPWVLDPVAAGASGFRLKACLELVELKPALIRGNGSEIIALSKASVQPSKGRSGLTGPWSGQVRKTSEQNCSLVRPDWSLVRPGPENQRANSARWSGSGFPDRSQSGRFEKPANTCARWSGPSFPERPDRDRSDRSDPDQVLRTGLTGPSQVGPENQRALVCSLVLRVFRTSLTDLGLAGPIRTKFSGPT
ncbi:hypothetical protein TIFTF001_047605 [Ficus carica]|uniref:hydroxyethylthiazole kinase n=1 Tax=Ficus carica TaxID=3494 RepID=A0AA87Z4D0_FICCA|nr:hypothetical protein TIFTF001_047605 [Ficus carica]